MATQSSIEYKVTVAPADRPWATEVVERFSGCEGEKKARPLAQKVQEELNGVGDAIVQVSCSQCW